MHTNPKKDKKRKAKKKAKKQRKIANRTAITLTQENDQMAIDAAIAKSDELWNLPIDVSEGTNAPVKYAFVEKEESARVMRLWDALGNSTEKKQMLSVNRLELSNLLEEALGSSVPVKLLAPPPKAVRVFQAQFLKCMMPETEEERKEREAVAKAAQEQAGHPVPVVLHGLKAENMNGRTGLRGPWEKEKGRFLVKLDSDNTLIYVQPENLKIMQVPTGGASEQAQRMKYMPPQKERGVVIMQPTSTILQVSVFTILKDRLQQLTVRADAMRGAWFLLLYILWIMSSASILVDSADATLHPPSTDGMDPLLDYDEKFDFGGDVISLSDRIMHPAKGSAMAWVHAILRWSSWMIIPFYLFATFQDSQECKRVRSHFSHLCDVTLCHDRSYPHTRMEFTADSYLAAAMLLLMVQSRLDYLAILYVVLWPQALLWIESFSKSTSANDKKCLSRMRITLLWVNKIFLLYKSWFVSWAGILTVCVVSFPTISKILFDLSIVGVMMAVVGTSRVIEFILRKAPVARTLSQWGQRSATHHLCLFIGSATLFCAVVWISWDWSRFIGLPLRVMIFLLLFSVFPQYIWKMFALAMALVQLLMNVSFGEDPHI